MEKSELISVIVPIYKVEDYLDRCVESIVNQTYKNLEIILVDDGSPDKCPQMCDEWSKKDNRIKVVHKENGGLSDARNAGMRIATGDYYSFIDSDDWINVNFYSIMMDVIIQEECDVVQCERAVLEKSSGEYLKDIESYSTFTYSSEEAISLLIQEKNFRQVVWNKLYKKSTIVEEFIKGAINEDEFWTYKIFGASDKIAYIDAKLYYYFVREGSIMGSGYSTKRLDGLKAIIERHEYVCENYSSLKDVSEFSVYTACMYHYQMVLKYIEKNERKNTLQYIESLSKKYYPNLKSVNSFKQKVWIKLSKISFNTTCKIRMIFGLGF